MMILLVAAAFVASVFATHATLRNASSLGLLDIPNERSAHSDVKPRGGGIAFTLVFLLGLVIAIGFGLVEASFGWLMLPTATLVCVIGLVDDIVGLSPVSRLVVHVIAALIAVLVLPTPEALQFANFSVESVAVLNLLVVLLLVWSINLFNFMDGIDGIAASQSVFVGVAMMVLADPNPELRVSISILLAALLGFLVFNWPPARIFMGDIGSGFLGFVMAAFGVYAHAVGALPITVWLLLNSMFLVDATATLVVRLCTGKRWYSAHSSHAYQHAARRLGSHRQVLWAMHTINLIAIFPLACAATAGWIASEWALALGWLPLVALALLIGAGRDRRSV